MGAQVDARAIACALDWSVSLCIRISHGSHKFLEPAWLCLRSLHMYVIMAQYSDLIDC